MIKKEHTFLFTFVLGIIALVGLFSETRACERCLQAGIFMEERQQTADVSAMPLIASHGELRHEAADDLHFFESREVVQRYRKISLDDRTKGSGWIRENDHMTLNLFDDVEHEVHVQRVKVNVNGTFTITGVLPDGDGYMVLATTDSRSLGSIFLPADQKYYKIISDPVTYTHYLIEMDAGDRDIIESGPSLIPEINEQDIREQERIKNQLKDQDLGPGDVATIGVMVVYTPRAENWAHNNGSGINNVIASAMANAQLVLDNSQVLMVATLVHSELVSYQESGSSQVDLVRLTASPDYNPWGNSWQGHVIPEHMDDVHFWRDQYRADLTAIFAEVSDTGGLAWLLTDRFGNPNRAFSLTRVQQAAGYTHIHEMGHNMGLHHHADQNFQPGPTNWSNWPDNKWSAGWRWLGNNNVRYVSVMSYSGGQYYADGQNATQVPYFSNPQIMHMGAPTGNSERGDNARTLLEIKHVIANYRPMGDPAVVTAEAKDITATTALSGGFIDDLDGLEVHTRGIVWNRSGNPTVNDNEGMTTDGAGIGHFESELTDLLPSSNYHVRAYAMTNEGVIHGTFQVFSTLVAYEPSVSTTRASDVTQATAMTGGNISYDGNATVTQRGVVWSTEPNPTIQRNMGRTTEGPGDGQFISQLTGLASETTYFYRSYATNIMGTSYGGQFEFDTTGPRVYPNPAVDYFYVDINNESEKTVYVLLANIYGNVIKRKPVVEQGETAVFFNTAQLRGGVYLVYVESDQKFPVWQLVIARQ